LVWLIIIGSSLERSRGGVVPSTVGDEWKTAYSAGFNSTTCARVRLEKMKAEGARFGKMGIMGIMEIWEE